MEELVECKEFAETPTTQASDFVDYFNLEFGTYPAKDFKGGDETPFYEHDFKFIGYFLSKDGQQQMYWTAGSRPNLFALAVPLTNGKAILSMTDVPPSELKEIELG